MLFTDINQCKTFAADGNYSLSLHTSSTVSSRPMLAGACEERGGYATPELNDVLYLHFGGYARLQELEAYTGVKALYAESNGLTEVSGIAHMSELRSLYLQNNLISSLRTGLIGLANLTNLNLASNQLRSLEGIRCLASLQTLNVSKNALDSVEGIRELAALEQLHSLDMSDNELPAAAGAPAGVDVATAAAGAGAADVMEDGASSSSSSDEPRPLPGSSIDEALRELRQAPPPTQTTAVAGTAAEEGPTEGEAPTVAAGQPAAAAPAREPLPPAPLMQPDVVIIGSSCAGGIAGADNGIRSGDVTSSFSDVRVDSVLGIVARLPKLGALYLSGNPLARDTRHYRKTVVSTLPQLRYLDDRPVGKLERVATDAWRAGGPHAEKAARLQHEAAERAAAKARLDGFKHWKADVRAKRAAAEAEAAGRAGTDSSRGGAYVSYSRVPSHSHSSNTGASRQVGSAAASEGTTIATIGAEASSSSSSIRAPDAALADQLQHLELLRREQQQQGGVTSVADLLPELETVPTDNDGDATAGGGARKVEDEDGKVEVISHRLLSDSSTLPLADTETPPARHLTEPRLAAAVPSNSEVTKGDTKPASGVVAQPPVVTYRDGGDGAVMSERDGDENGDNDVIGGLYAASRCADVSEPLRLYGYYDEREDANTAAANDGASTSVGCSSAPTTTTASAATAKVVAAVKMPRQPLETYLRPTVTATAMLNDALARAGAEIVTCDSPVDTDALARVSGGVLMGADEQRSTVTSSDAGSGSGGGSGKGPLSDINILSDPSDVITRTTTSTTSRGAFTSARGPGDVGNSGSAAKPPFDAAAEFGLLSERYPGRHAEGREGDRHLGRGEGSSGGRRAGGIVVPTAPTHHQRQLF